MRYFSARSPKSCDVGHAMNDVSPCTPSLYATGKIDNGAPSADFVVHQSVEQMVEALVRADVHMDTMSNKELGVEAHDVPAEVQGTLNFAMVPDLTKNQIVVWVPPLLLRSGTC